jgi:hypothetical protein
MMSSKPASDQKLKPTAQQPEAVVSTGSRSDVHQSDCKARRVSSDASVSTVAPHQTTTEVSHVQHNPKLTREHIRKVFPDLYHSDSARVTAALDAVYMDLYEDKLDPINGAGFSLAIVYLVEGYLKRATEKLPACDRVTKMNEFAELKPLHAAIDVIVLLTHRHHECRDRISTQGGVETIVNTIKSFPKCLALQENACAALRNLTCSGIGQKKALEAGQTIDLLLAAMKNHLLVSPCLCVHAVLTLHNVIAVYNLRTNLLPSSEHDDIRTKLLLSSGSVATAINKVRDQWPEEDSVQEAVRMLASVLPQQTTIPSKPSNERKRKPRAQEREAVVRTGSDDHQSETRAARRKRLMLAFKAHQEKISHASNDRKRKTAQQREAVVSTGSDDHQTDRKARRLSPKAEQTDRKVCRVSMEAEPSTVASQQTTEEAKNHVRRNSKLSMGSIIKLFPDLFHSDSAKARAAHDTMFWDLYEDKLNELQAAGGYLVLVKVVKDRLRSATEIMLACDGRGVTKFEFTELNAAIYAIVLLTNGHHQSRVEISMVGGVETIVKVMESFPKCLALQENACAALRNLTYCSIGKKKALEAAQTIDVLLAAMKNHLVSFNLCEYAVLALRNFVRDDNISTKFLLRGGGVAAAIKVREEWINKGSVQRAVQMLMVPLLEELNSWKQAN